MKVTHERTIPRYGEISYVDSQRVCFVIFDLPAEVGKQRKVRDVYPTSGLYMVISGGRSCPETGSLALPDICREARHMTDMSISRPARLPIDVVDAEFDTG